MEKRLKEIREILEKQGNGGMSYHARIIEKFKGNLDNIMNNISKLPLNIINSKFIVTFYYYEYSIDFFNIDDECIQRLFYDFSNNLVDIK